LGHVPVSAFEFAKYDLADHVSRPPPQYNIPQQVKVGPVLARWELSRPLVRTIPSPINPTKHYHEFNILFANSVDFGTKDEKTSLVAMHTVFAPGKVQLKLDLDRKALDIMFPLKLGDTMRKFRFRLPIARLSHIYKETKRRPGQNALIIPFESPPQFFVQKHEGEILSNKVTHTSFFKSEKTWVDWNTWFRETDVVDAVVKETMRDIPLMSNKETAIIDIGKLMYLRRTTMTDSIRALD
jgi:RNA-dependent RNA polymerase